MKEWGGNSTRSFPVIKEEMDRAAAVADFDLLHLLFHERGGESAEDQVAAAGLVRPGICHGPIPHHPGNQPGGHGRS